MKLGRPGIAVVTIALALAIPLGTGANATTLVVQSTATISGTVTGGGLAIVGACVSVEGSGLPISTTTDGSGHYVLPGVVPDVSTFGLRVDPSCSTDAHAVDYLFFYDAISVPSAAPQTIDVALVLGGSASGSVVDAAHHPIANVCISIMTPDHQSYGFTQSRSDGTFTVAGVTPGTYIATLDGCYGAQQGPTRDIQPQFYNNTQNQLNAVPIVVQLGVTTGLQQQTMLDAGEINLTLTPPAGVSPDELLIEMLPPANAPQGLELRGNIIGLDAQGNAQIRNLLPIGYTIGYEYCPPSQPCRPDVGFYKNQGIDNPVPTIVTPTPGVLQTLTDSVVIPPFTGSTVTLTTTPAPHVAGSVVAITATVVPTSGSHVPVGTVDFSDTTSQAEAPGNINGQATIDAQGRATLLASNVAAGLHTIVAGYRGDGGTSQSMSQPLSFTVDPASTGGGGGGGSAPASGNVTAGGTLTSDPTGTTPDASNPLVVGVTSPVGGAVTIDKTAPNTPIGHYSVLGVGATITAPTATPGDPLHLTFQVFDGTLPAGSHASDITIFRDGVAVAACTGAGATPDPCVASVTTSGGVTTFDVRSSHASTWDVEAARVGRVAGPDRIATAVAVSQDSFPNGHAGAVVLARADDYPDALVGGPLAAAKNAPLLLTQGLQLPAATATELSRVLPAGGTVYVLGGTTAVPASVAMQITALGYQVVRYAGVDRYTTAATVAEALGNPATVLLATGTNFPDALAAGPAAAHVHGAILLTSGSTMPKVTSDYVAAAHTVYAIGGPAATAAPTAQAIVGTDRFATAAAVAAKFFPSSTMAGVATGAGFPDALAGGAQLALLGAPLLLSSQATVPASTTAYLGNDHSALTNIYVYGGAAVLGNGVVSQLAATFGS